MIIPLQINKLWIDSINTRYNHAHKSNEVEQQKGSLFIVSELFGGVIKLIGLKQQVLESFTFFTPYYHAESHHFKEGQEV